MMNASNITQVTDLIVRHRRAREALANLEAIPRTADTLNVSTHWPNPDLDAPAHHSTVHWSFTMPMGDVKTNQTMQLVRELLEARRAEIAEQLIQLGVDPNG